MSYFTYISIVSVYLQKYTYINKWGGGFALAIILAVRLKSIHTIINTINLIHKVNSRQYYTSFSNYNQIKCNHNTCIHRCYVNNYILTKLNNL